ncbi:hypothetical protein R0137_00455 [Congregibacter brevis]|uniref:VOC family protein n=1 Tax=Congregibacter brevis TaxID=3081201 RepID=A0ABZ0IC00_9GAMM|nr:hypothetical protein R0137_00455 [Congregibacter sp. IMCC45268]
MLKAVAPYLCVRDGAAAIEFYKTAFAAKEVQRYEYEGKLRDPFGHVWSVVTQSEAN